MPRVNFVKSARKEGKTDKGEDIKVGMSYYWWKFRYGGMHKSLTQPVPRQLTQNAFKLSMFDFEDLQSNYTVEDLKNDGVEPLTSELETMRDDAQNSLENMPESLQENSDSGQLLQERIDALQEMIDELEGISIPDEPETDELNQTPAPVEPAVPPDDAPDDLKLRYSELKAKYDEDKEKYDEEHEETEQYDQEMEDALGEVQNVSYGGP